MTPDLRSIATRLSAAVRRAATARAAPATLMRAFAHVLLLALLASGLPAAAADVRPTVCLVLSGGGARGAAHVGVLRVLEELHVPVDCIAGTSMGSIVGGAYAGGMTLAEMEAALATISTRGLFTEKLPRGEQAIRRKIDDRSILFGVELGLNDGRVQLPKGAVTGVQLETVLRSLVKTKGVRNFDDLPIPFRAVATDLVNGKAVVLARGELANAMRASMSVPGAIAPAEIDGQLLVDGGLTDNLPIDVARAMGADVVIAVNLGTPLMKRDELGSVLGVTGQMINILTEQNVRASLAMLRPADILIEPELGDFSAADFDELPKTIPIGEAAARRVAERLRALALPADAFAARRAAQIAAAHPSDDTPIDEIRIDPLARVNPDVVRGLMRTTAGQPLDPKVIDRDMLRVFGTGDFEHVNYRLLEEAGRRVLTVDAAEKSWGPNYVRFGLGLGTDLEGDSFFNLAASYRRTWVNSLGAELRADLQAGRTSRLAGEFYQPLQVNGMWFVAPAAVLERRQVDVFKDSQRIARYSVRRTVAGLDVGANLGPIGEARLGFVGGRVSSSLQTGPEALRPPDSPNDVGALTARVIIDQLDNANFPRAGYGASAHLLVSREALGASHDYAKWDAEGMWSWSTGRHTVSFAGKAGGALGNEGLPTYDLLQWGGLLQQSGYPIGALLGGRLTFGRAVYMYKLMDQPFFDGLYAGVSLEAGRMDKPLIPGNYPGLLKSAAAFLGFDTPIGPLYVGFGRAADGNSSGYLYLGRP